MDIALNNDKAVQQDAAQQQQHAQAVGHHNVPGNHGGAAEDADAHLVGHKHNGPEHEKPARHATLKMFWDFTAVQRKMQTPTWSVTNTMAQNMKNLRGM